MDPYSSPVGTTEASGSKFHDSFSMSNQ